MFHGEFFCKILVKISLVHLLSRPRFCDICLSQAATLKLAISIATRSTALFHKLSTFVLPRDKRTNRNSSSHRRRTCRSCELISISSLDSVSRFSYIRLDSKSTVAMHFGTQSMERLFSGVPLLQIYEAMLILVARVLIWSVSTTSQSASHRKAGIIQRSSHLILRTRP